MSKSKHKTSNISPVIIIISILITLILIIILFKLYPQININQYINQDNNSNISPLKVTKVIDGDTFELANKQIVRLICVDSPEQGKPGSEEAKSFLESLILDKEVILEKDVSDTDKYDRLLKYVYVNMTKNKTDNVNRLKGKGEKEEVKVFVNKEMVKEGYATIFQVPPDVKRCGEISE